MRDYSSQKNEIETIKPRTITVNLSDADVKRLAEKSGEGGLTISELLENFIGDLDDFIDLMNEMESSKKEMAEVTADAENCSAEERDELQEYINDLQKEIDYYWGKFLERKRQKESYVFEKEIKNIMAWKSQLDTILDPKNP